MIIALFLLSKYYLFLHLFWEEEKEEAGGNDRVVVFATKPADGDAVAGLESATIVIAASDAVRLLESVTVKVSKCDTV